MYGIEIHRDQKMKVNWNNPKSTPDVEKGTEKLCWLAVKAESRPPVVFLAHYQNRPLELDEDGEPLDECNCLSNCDGEYIESIGWVDCKEHYEFDNFYTPLSFNKDYRLLAWAECKTPTFASNQ